jgi:C-terminal processing protease CtpA/Prc
MGHQPDTTLDRAGRRLLVDQLAAALDRTYIDAGVARRMATALRDRSRRGAYERITSAKALAETLTTQLQSWSHDKHLSVFYSHDPLPAGRGATLPSPEIEAEERRYSASINHGIEAVRRLAGNVGYIDLRELLLGGDDKIESAMRLVADTDALIIDLRRCRGGRPEVSRLLISYLLPPEPVLVGITWQREPAESLKVWSQDSLPGPRYTGRQVLLLTSRRTFSAGEMLAYTLQSMGRARVVGDTTGGGGHGINFRQLTPHFAASIPFIKPIDPNTGRGWEGEGVVPDVRVPADQALGAAQAEALRGVLRAKTTSEDRQRIERMLADLEQGRDPEAAEPQGARIIRR